MNWNYSGYPWKWEEFGAESANEKDTNLQWQLREREKKIWKQTDRAEVEMDGAEDTEKYDDEA